MTKYIGFSESLFLLLFLYMCMCARLKPDFWEKSGVTNLDNNVDLM